MIANGYTVSFKDDGNVQRCLFLQDHNSKYSKYHRIYLNMRTLTYISFTINVLQKAVNVSKVENM